MGFSFLPSKFFSALSYKILHAAVLKYKVQANYVNYTAVSNRTVWPFLSLHHVLHEFSLSLLLRLRGRF